MQCQIHEYIIVDEQLLFLYMFKICTIKQKQERGCRMATNCHDKLFRTLQQ